MTSNAFLLQLLLENILSCDAGMVRTRHTQRVVALHSLPSDQHVLDGITKRVADMERTGDVWRWNRYAVNRTVSLRLEITSRVPGLIPLLLYTVRLVCFR